MLQPVHEDRKFLGSGWQAQEATAEIIHVSFIFHFTKAQEWRTELQMPLHGSTGKQRKLVVQRGEEGHWTEKHTAGREGGLFEWFGWYESEKGLPCSSKPTYQAFKHLP